MISNSGSDENGRISGGKPGDQTGNEWNIRAWYNRPWTRVLRHPNKKVKSLLTKLSYEAAENDNIGYNQLNRDSYWKYLKLANYDPTKITTKCDADCSAGVIANVKAVGFLLDDFKLGNISATYTGNMCNSLVGAGFKNLTDTKYLTSDKYLEPGDILLNDSHHTCVNLTYGSAVSKSIKAKDVIYTTEEIYLRTGVSSKTIQAPYKRYKDLPDSTKSKIVKVNSDNSKVKLQRNIAITVRDTVKNGGDIWVRGKDYWLPVYVNGKWRVV